MTDSSLAGNFSTKMSHNDLADFVYNRPRPYPICFWKVWGEIPWYDETRSVAVSC